MIISNGKYHMTETANSYYSVQMKLVIRKFQKSDLGGYKCISKNSIGDAEGNIRLYGKCVLFSVFTRPPSRCFTFPSPLRLIYNTETMKCWWNWLPCCRCNKTKLNFLKKSQKFQPQSLFHWFPFALLETKCAHCNCLKKARLFLFIGRVIFISVWRHFCKIKSLFKAFRISRTIYTFRFMVVRYALGCISNLCRHRFSLLCSAVNSNS